MPGFRFQLHVEDDIPTSGSEADGKLTKEEREKLVDQIKRKDRFIKEYQKRWDLLELRNN